MMMLAKAFLIPTARGSVPFVKSCKFTLLATTNSRHRVYNARHIRSEGGTKK
jgi:hypothetical protein